MSLLSNKRKALIVGLVAVVAIGIMSILQYRALNDYQLLGQLRLLVRDVESNMLTLRRNEKDFLARKDLAYQRRFNDNYWLIQARVQELRSGLEAHAVEHSQLTRLEQALATYKDRFLEMVSLQQQIGFNHQDGYYGSMREAIHQVEDLLQAQRQDPLLKDMLMLRRHEKDFMLRNDNEYKEKFDKDMKVLQSDLSDTYLPDGVRTEISAALAAYEKDFEALVSATEQMGFSSNEGLHGQMRASIHQGEDILNSLSRQTLTLESDAGSHMINQILIFAVVLTVLIGALIRL